jgi:hypothetical protein
MIISNTHPPDLNPGIEILMLVSVTISEWLRLVE